VIGTAGVVGVQRLRQSSAARASIGEPSPQ
jgi:hypothetical protein